MTCEVDVRAIRKEAPLLFSLLDAIDSEQLLQGTGYLARWMALRERINAGVENEAESEDLFELLQEVGSTNAIRGTWIEHRWLSAKKRVFLDSQF
jgi:hypothetical protein